MNAPDLGLSNMSQVSSGKPWAATIFRAESMKDLPPRYRRKPIDPIEMEYIDVSELPLNESN